MRFPVSQIAYHAFSCGRFCDFDHPCRIGIGVLIQKVRIVQQCLFVPHILAQEPDFPGGFAALQMGVSLGKKALEFFSLLRWSVDDDIGVLCGAEDIGVVVVKTIRLKPLIAFLALQIPFYIVGVTRSGSAEEICSYTETFGFFSDELKLWHTSHSSANFVGQ